MATNAAAPMMLRIPISPLDAQTAPNRKYLVGSPFPSLTRSVPSSAISCRAQSLQVWHWMRLPMGTTSIARMIESIRRAKRVINQFLEGGCNTSPFVLGLLHQDVDHVQLRIYAEISTTTAVPLEFTD